MPLNNRGWGFLINGQEMSCGVLSEPAPAVRGQEVLGLLALSGGCCLWATSGHPVPQEPIFFTQCGHVVAREIH